MDSVNDVKNILHSSYDHALRTGDLLVFSATEYEKMLTKIDEFFDKRSKVQNVRGLDDDLDNQLFTKDQIEKDLIAAAKAKKEITDQKVRDALGLDKDLDDDLDDQFLTKDQIEKGLNDSAEVNKDIIDAQKEQDAETVIDQGSEKQSETSEMDNLPEDDVNLPSESVSQTDDYGSDTVFESTESESDFDAGALVNTEHDKLVEKNQETYQAEDFMDTGSTDVQPTAKSESESVKEPLFK